MRPDDETVNADRRGFLRLLALVGMSSAAGRASFALAADPPAQKGPARATPAAPAAADSSAQAGPPPPSEDARALAGIVERRSGAHLTPAQLEDVTREIDGRLRAGERLRKADLANADEPDFTFGA